LIFRAGGATFRALNMMLCFKKWAVFPALLLVVNAFAAPVIDPIGNVIVPAGKSLIIPVTASSTNGLALTFSATSSTNRIVVEVHTNNPFWKMSVVQAAPANAPGAFQTPFRGGVVTVTNIGDLTFMLFRDITPHTVDVIQGLTQSGFYDSTTIFHRIVPGFVIQGGDPNTNGNGGPVFRFDDELHPRALFTGNGQLAMANSGKDTDGSQFFITAGPQRFLDLGYTLFGQLLRGFNVATNIINTPIDGNSRPLADVIITRASLVPDITDSALTLTVTNFAGVTGTINVIADDGAGGRTTNAFTATTISSAVNDQPILNLPAITNRIIAVNGRSTNFISALDLEKDPMYYDAYFVDFNAFLNSTIANFNGTNGQFVVVPNPGYSGPLKFYVAVGSDTNFSKNDYQQYTFAVGDTAIIALGTNFVAQPMTPFTSQIVATFTNGVLNSAVANFAASINWGDNAVTLGLIQTNVGGRKEVLGFHTYTNAGNYPIYVNIQSALGMDATVVSMAVVPPGLSLARTGTNNVVRWPAWAMEYHLLSHTNLSTTNWVALTNLPGLAGYENVITNNSTGGNRFFRLKR
jgi:cyclophilin family peptidyl-prolyl cis-trans isomerase